MIAPYQDNNYEVVKVAALQWIFFEGEMFVGAQIVDPELVRPRFLGCRFAVEEEDVGFTLVFHILPSLFVLSWRRDRLNYQIAHELE